MKILVIGGNGFLGSNFIKYIVNKHPNWEIVNYSRSEKSGNLDPLRGISGNENYSFVKGDILDTYHLAKNVVGVDYVFNAVGESNIRHFVEAPQESVSLGLGGINSVLEAVRGQGIKKIVCLSSWEVYGDKKGGLAKEEDKLNPDNLYASAKVAIEEISKGYYNSHGVPVVTIRSCNIFGPYQSKDKMISRSITNLLDGKKISLFGGGSEVRAYLYVEDFCNAIDLLLEKGIPGEVYNTGSKYLISNLDLAKLIMNKMERSEESLEFLHDKKTDNRRMDLGLDKIEELGWKPEIGFSEGLQRTITSYSDAS
jgi:dTDP-glucose 4,6-dehydratase